MVARSPLQHTCSRRLCLRFPEVNKTAKWTMNSKQPPRSFQFVDVEALCCTFCSRVHHHLQKKRRFLRSVTMFLAPGNSRQKPSPKCMNSSVVNFSICSCWELFLISFWLLFALANWLQSAYRHENTTDLANFFIYFFYDEDIWRNTTSPWRRYRYLSRSNARLGQWCFFFLTILHQNGGQYQAGILLIQEL